MGRSGGADLVDDEIEEVLAVPHGEQRLGAVFVGGCHLAEVGDEVFEELAPGYRMSVS